MGEAKRRKANDPTFGKKKKKIFVSEEKAKRWWEKSKLLLAQGDRPDYGHWCLMSFGEKEVTLKLEGEFFVFPAMECWKLLVAIEPSFVVSILISKEESEEHFEGREKDITSLSVKARPLPEWRGLAIFGEIVIPFEIQSVLHVDYSTRSPFPRRNLENYRALLLQDIQHCFEQGEDVTDKLRVLCEMGKENPHEDM